MVAKEPLLRIAISRGLTLSLEDLDRGGREEEEEGEGGGRGDTAKQTGEASASSSRGEGGRRREGERESKPDASTGEPSCRTLMYFTPR